MDAMKRMETEFAAKDAETLISREDTNLALQVA
jgi:hypothetical protein